MEIGELIEKSRKKRAIDEFIGIVYKKEGSIFFRYRRDFDRLFVPAEKYREFVDAKHYDGVIVWIIESPHKWEFKINIPLFPEGRHHARPLNNPSTQRYVKPVFEERIVNFLSSSIGEGALYLVLLVNSVEYQCSLGEKTSLYRDRAFIGNWLTGGREDFLKRIESYKGDIFINSCTKGSINRGFLERNFNLIERPVGNYKFKEIDGRLGLHGIVEAELEFNNFIHRSNYIRYPHPSYFVYQETRGGKVSFPEAESLTPAPILTFGIKKGSIKLTLN